MAITLHCQGDELAGLPAAVEVAAYRIVTEALTNVVRHASACSCEVRISLDQGLTIDVCDDGVGFPEGWRAGVGITAMRERAAELGGDLGIQSREPHGTSIARAAAGREAGMTDPIRVLIADDHPLFRDGLTACSRQLATSS